MEQKEEITDLRKDLQYLEGEFNDFKTEAGLFGSTKDQIKSEIEARIKFNTEQLEKLTNESSGWRTLIEPLLARDKEIIKKQVALENERISLENALAQSTLDTEMAIKARLEVIKHECAAIKESRRIYWGPRLAGSVPVSLEVDILEQIVGHNQSIDDFFKELHKPFSEQLEKYEKLLLKFTEIQQKIDQLQTKIEEKEKLLK